MTKDIGIIVLNMQMGREMFREAKWFGPGYTTYEWIELDLQPRWTPVSMGLSIMLSFCDLRKETSNYLTALLWGQRQILSEL